MVDLLTGWPVPPGRCHRPESRKLLVGETPGREEEFNFAIRILYMKKYAVIVAGGAGVRMGTNTPKQFLLLRNKPVLWHTLSAFLSAFDDLTIILVLPALHLDTGREIIATLAAPERVQITTGGDTRYQSVQNGLQLAEKDAVIFVHDGVRCLVTPALIQKCYTTTLEKGNATPAVAAVDSIRIETAGGNEVMDRNKVRIIQTPQTFLGEQLLKAFAQPYEASFTDEATVVERMGFAIHLVEGEPANIKITQPVDLLLAEKILEERG